MSREIRNQRVLDAVRKLPGREDPTDQSRGYVGWGPDEDATSGGRTVEHATWQDLLGAIQNPAREIHDFYFSHHVPSQECPCCAGSGRNKDFAELNSGFYRGGGGRWRGWSARLTQEEVDVLVDGNRLWRAEKEVVTPDNVQKFLEPFGHDEINRWLLTPVRAKALGISTAECFDCVGTGQVPTADAAVRLYAWTFDAAAGTSRVDTAENVPLGEIGEIREFMADIGWEGVKRRLGWAVSDNMHPEIVYEDKWQTFGDRTIALKGEPSFWGQDGSHPTWQHFFADHSALDPDMNLVFDYKIVAAENIRDVDFSGSELPEKFGLRLWITYPRKGSDVVIAIRECTREDAAEIKEYLSRSYQVHGRHFAWAVGREFGNEAVASAGEPETEENAMSMFMGR